MPSSRADVHEAVLGWYRARPHDYPWRVDEPDPFAVLVSEIMLQQTQAARVAPAYRAFLQRFPDVRSLASSGRADLLRAWGRLGYPRRAIALREGARVIVHRHGGVVPRERASLVALPGVGPYTAAAVASIAFGEPIAAVATNTRRIIARLLHGLEPDGVRPRALRADADAMVARGAPGAWNQALMDLGRSVCRPAPRCDACPLSSWCRFDADGETRRRTTRRQPAFRGSMRQARGLVLSVLREVGSASVASLAHTTGMAPERTAEAVRGLAADGVVSAAADISVDTYVSID
jgi:A/G-specific adenine glycosylase